MKAAVQRSNCLMGKREREKEEEEVGETQV